MDKWWIDEPVLLGSSNPTDSDLSQMFSGGFSVIVCLLDLREQQPAYNRSQAVSEGWEWHNISIQDFAAPTVKQIETFLAIVASGVMKVKRGRGAHVEA